MLTTQYIKQPRWPSVGEQLNSYTFIPRNTMNQLKWMNKTDVYYILIIFKASKQYLKKSKGWVDCVNITTL